MKQIKENVITNFQANYGSNPEAHQIQIFIMNLMEQFELAVISEIRHKLVKESTVGENTINVFDDIVRKL